MDTPEDDLAARGRSIFDQLRADAWDGSGRRASAPPSPPAPEDPTGLTVPAAGLDGPDGESATDGAQEQPTQAVPGKGVAGAPAQEAALPAEPGGEQGAEPVFHVEQRAEEAGPQPGLRNDAPAVGSAPEKGDVPPTVAPPGGPDQPAGSAVDGAVPVPAPLPGGDAARAGAAEGLAEAALGTRATSEDTFHVEPGADDGGDAPSSTPEGAMFHVEQPDVPPPDDAVTPADAAGEADPHDEDGSQPAQDAAAASEAAPMAEPAPAPAPAPPRPVRPLPRTMAVANQKGGVGKTTTAVNLGAALAELGYRTLVVDLDPQGNATTGLGINARSLTSSVYDVLMRELPVEDAVEPTSVRNLFVVPATIDLAGAEIELVPAFSRELRLKRALEGVADDFDFTLIDCPPSLGLLTVNALAAATEVIVPVQCEYYALEGLSALLRNVQLVQTNLNRALEMSTIVLTMYDARTKLAEQVAHEVRSHFGNVVCRQMVPRTVRLSEAPSFGQPIIVFDPSSRGAIAYRELAKEVSGGAPQRVG